MGALCLPREEWLAPSLVRIVLELSLTLFIVAGLLFATPGQRPTTVLGITGDEMTGSFPEGRYTVAMKRCFLR